MSREASDERRAAGTAGAAAGQVTGPTIGQASGHGQTDTASPDASTHQALHATNRFWQDRRVLITGANGFIAAWLARRLTGLGAVVTGYDRSDRGALDLHEGLRSAVDLALGDLTDQPKIEGLLTEKRIQTLYHLGAQSSIAIARGSPVPAFESNIRGTWAVLDACRAVGTLDSIAVASSLTAYGDQEISPFDESFALNGNQPYAASKVCTDVIARCYAATYGLPIGIARTANIFGPADPHLDHIIPGTLLALLRGERPEIRSDGSPTKGYLYVSDIVEAYRLLGERAGDADVRGRAFNFHPDEPISVLDLVRAMMKVANRPDLEPRITGTPGQYEHVWLANARARCVLGWDQQVPLEAGLRDTLAWLREHAGTRLERAAEAFHG
ncbi:MAG: GDP-mannose 4,6-dehydratase [Chloroflexi bacterium]|nr:GDP-mannose 4,6-dehydratase [Chloroflexota bacterium]